MNAERSRGFRAVTDDLTVWQASAHREPVHRFPPISARHPGLQHLDSTVAVAASEVEVLLTTVRLACRLTPDQARAVGWALIEAAEYVEPST